MSKIILLLFSMFSLNSFASIGPSFKNDDWKKSSDWKEVIQLKDDQKFKAALEQVEKKLKKFTDDNDELNWTRALFLKQQLTVGLHKPETALKEFKEANWPKAISSQIVLHLYYAQTLQYYFQTYSWEINKREKIDSKQKLDIKKWTKEEISQEIYQTLSAIWKLREKLGNTANEEFSEFISIGNYPKEVRGTIRDSLTYLFVQFLQDSQYWTARHSNETKMLELKKLIEGSDEFASDKFLNDLDQHPLLKIVGLLNDLEKWHWSKDRISALIEARLEKYRIIAENFADDLDTQFLIKSLQSSLGDYEVDAWWSEAMYLLASFKAKLADDESIIQAIELAEKGMKAHPKSIGGKRCEAFIANQKAPTLNVQVSAHDFTNKPSILITYKNWRKVYFKAYKFDPIKFMLSNQKSRYLPNRQELQEILKPDKVVLNWEVELEPTKDFKEHKMFGAIPLKENGFYVIVSSAKEDFSETQNYQTANYVNLTNLRVLKESIDNDYHFQVKDAESGKAVKAKIHFYQEDWKTGHKLLKSVETDKFGKLIAGNQILEKNKSHYFMVETSDDKYYDLGRFYYSENYKIANQHSAVILTDRSVYRPGQTVRFKVISYENRVGKNELPKARPNVPVVVELMDNNWKQVDRVELKTNQFASASGSFKIPSGRALGVWHIGTSANRQSIRVEEYKRPTFTAQLKDLKKQAKLNKEVTVQGEAKYYYGGAVANGKVTWSVTRKASYPFWYYWWWGSNVNTNPQVIAGGITKTNEKGEFEISFIPKAPTREVENGVSYHYAISADILDAGGETASADKVFRLGKFAIEAQILSAESLYTDADRTHFTLKRTDLNNKLLAGKGEYELYALETPQRTLKPTEYPLYYMHSKKKLSKYATKGDDQRSRWNPLNDENSIMMSFKSGKKLASGSVDHKESGEADLDLGKLKSGCYRLIYKSKDVFGSEFTTAKEFYVTAKKTTLKLPLLLASSKLKAFTGDTVKFFVYTGYEKQNYTFEILKGSKVIYSKNLNSSQENHFINKLIESNYQGGITARVYTVVDHTLIEKKINITIPYVQKDLQIDLSRIRKEFYPGIKQEWTINIKGTTPRGKKVNLLGQAEVLAFMYDKSLDAISSYHMGNISHTLPTHYRYTSLETFKGIADITSITHSLTHFQSTNYLTPAHLLIENSIGIGGPGMRSAKGGIAYEMASDVVMKSSSPSPKLMAKKESIALSARDEDRESKADVIESEQPKEQIRTNFSETAFFEPHLLTDKKGNVKISFTAPDSLTAWNLWTQAITKDLDWGEQMLSLTSVKDLMVRSYLPRFFRQGDKIEVKVVVTNAGKKDLKGKFHFEINRANSSAAPNFQLDEKFLKGIELTLKSGASLDISVPVVVPSELGEFSIKTYAKMDQFTDGEEKKIQVLPSRSFLSQSRFITLTNEEKRVLEFPDMLQVDESRIHDSLVVKIDSQLFYGVLSALPYLVEYPYECSEQTLNRFLSASILGKTFEKFPSIKQMAQKMKTRKTQYEAFNRDDPNRKMSLEETPWLRIAEGGQSEGLLNMLDAKVVQDQTKFSLEKLKDMQTSSGGFPWFAGGPPSFYMTTYVILGLAKAQNFDVEIPRKMTIKAWQYVQTEYKKMVDECMRAKSCYETITLINFVASSFKNQEYLGGTFPMSERLKMLDYSFKHWKEISPQIKAMLAMTLKRMDREKDALLVFDSIMDSAQTNKDQGTFWAPEDRSWLWYNDTIETHSYILKAMLEVKPKDEIRHGLVQWLFINKKLNHWKSTKATAEVIYTLLHYLQAEDQVSIEQKVNVKLGGIEKQFDFKPDEYTGKDNFIVVQGDKIDEKNMAKIQVEQTSKGMSFASATWHYSTEKLPTEERGDFFKVTRSFYLRKLKEGKMQLTPLSEGAKIQVGNEVEVHLSISSKHAAEYVQLRDPRPAGFEPVTNKSGYQWDLGLIRYEEIRDSGVNFFMESIPVGEYTLKHRLRANLAGEFRVNPATIQSIYAPEFSAFSSGMKIIVNQ